MVSGLIVWEGSALLSSLFFGMILAVEYDCIRIFRRVIRHRKVWTMSMEDIIFWINAGITVFVVTYDVNNGIVRGFMLGGFVIGSVIYRYAFGRFIVKYGAKFILILLKPLKKVLSALRIILTRLARGIKKQIGKVRTGRNCRKGKDSGHEI